MSARPARTRGAAAWGVALALSVAAGCTGPQARDSEPPVPSATVATPTAGAPVSASLPVPTTLPSATSGGSLSVRQTSLVGHSGSVSWRVKLPVFAGTDAATEINRRVRASAQDAIDAARREAKDDDGAHRTLTGESSVTTNDGRTVQVVTSYSDNLEGTAHPTYAVRTTVVTTLAGDPVVLADVFDDEKAALTALGRAVTKVAKADGDEVDPEGLAPKEANWAAWQTTTLGMEFHFQDYQLGGHGLRTYTVPWLTVQPLMSDQARALLAPR